MSTPTHQVALPKILYFRSARPAATVPFLDDSQWSTNPEDLAGWGVLNRVGKYQLVEELDVVKTTTTTTTPAKS